MESDWTTRPPSLSTPFGHFLLGPLKLTSIYIYFLITTNPTRLDYTSTSSNITHKYKIINVNILNLYTFFKKKINYDIFAYVIYTSLFTVKHNSFPHHLPISFSLPLISYILTPFFFLHQKNYILHFQL